MKIINEYEGLEFKSLEILYICITMPKLLMLRTVFLLILVLLL